ncbi:hypothetical protein P3S67_026475 [Capsicum chacoense]
MAKETAKKMWWHKEENIEDGFMRHPSDSIEWKSLNERYPTFSTELRNVQLGPKCPGNDIDIYLQPMVEELNELWNGLETYDAYSKSNFLLRVALLWMINDFPAYGNLSRWSTKGKFPCPFFHKDTRSISFRSKLCYLGHRHFLPTNHPWRRN